MTVPPSHHSTLSRGSRGPVPAASGPLYPLASEQRLRQGPVGLGLLFFFFLIIPL